MRLIHTETLELKEFFGDPKDSYTILSHTWGDAEVTLREFKLAKDATTFGKISGDPSLAAKAGYRKILACCAQSKDDGYQWTWVDTCCIDKTDSLELSESINSMFQWYQNAAVCYVFLDDVAMDLDTEPLDAICRSRWFERGWTLQELIAPPRLIMFDAAWRYIGKLTEGTALSAAVSQATGVPSIYLHEGSIHSASISMRMSWASKRQTTRAEDMAYCLLGIFNVNMPLLYGEGGHKAFIRLQEEIIKNNHDQTIFAWKTEYTPSHLIAEAENIGILAPCPAAFESSGNLVPSIREADSEPTPFEMTNLGLRICLPLWHSEKYDEFLGLLACHEVDAPDKRVMIRLCWPWTILREADDGYRLPSGTSMPPVWRGSRAGRDTQRLYILERYRLYKRSPIKSGTTLYRRNGPFSFEFSTPSASDAWYTGVIRRIHSIMFIRGLRLDFTSSEVLISQPRSFQPLVTQILFKFPSELTWDVLPVVHPALKVLKSQPGSKFSLVVEDQEAQEFGRKDIYISLKRRWTTDDAPCVPWKWEPQVLVASFHWNPRQRSYRLFMTRESFKITETSTQDGLYIDRTELGRTQLDFEGRRYYSLISNYGPQSVRVEIKGTIGNSAVWRVTLIFISLFGLVVAIVSSAVAVILVKAGECLIIN